MVNTDLAGACTDEDDEDCDTSDGQLELDELGGIIADIATPQHGLGDRRQIAIGQYNIGRFLGDITAGHALYEHRHEGWLIDNGSERKISGCDLHRHNAVVLWVFFGQIH